MKSNHEIIFIIQHYKIFKLKCNIINLFFRSATSNITFFTLNFIFFKFTIGSAINLMFHFKNKISNVTLSKKNASTFHFVQLRFIPLSFSLSYMSRLIEPRVAESRLNSFQEIFTSQMVCNGRQQCIKSNLIAKKINRWKVFSKSIQNAPTGDENMWKYCAQCIVSSCLSC